jgi:hypothetical protein
VVADWDSSGTDAGTDTIEISKTSTADTADAYDVDPDTENYAAGNDPDIACRNQGRPDSPNGWGSNASADGHQENDGYVQGDHYAEGTGEHDEPREDAYDGDTADLWGDTDPDAANYADLDGIGTGSLDGRQDSVREDEPDASPDADQPGQDQHVEGNAERTLSPEQQRVNALEADNADAKQQIAEANQKIAELEAKNDEQATQLNEQGAQLNEQAARLDRIEQLLAGSEKNPDDANVQERGDKSVTSADQQRSQDGSISERENSDERKGTKEAERSRWRRVTSSESLGLVNTFGGAVQTVGEFAVHATPEGMVGLGLTAVGVAQLLRARAEKKAERKGKR